MPVHDHREATLSIVVRGGFKEQVGRSERDYGCGHAAFFPAGVAHAQAFGPRGARQIIFEPQAAWIEHLADSRVALDRAPHVHSAALHHLGDRLIREMRVDDAFTALACDGLMAEIVAAFGREIEDGTCGRPPAWLRTALDFIHTNAARPLGLAEIATGAGRHEVHLAREFRRHFGTPVGAYIRQSRVEHAARLLRQHGLSLTEIALECGFSSHSHLCRTFIAYHGVTPSQYRSSVS
ncbi:AraC family transcriptional regulator (plasmid) [Polymorphobacter sp. PAMC 29334]|uniref:helix-turn-helix domain-containing protein n=1 Tax=Polymorphobacter sp. PAMC 29334 TaxID=2862331 RepID=UPI001C665263|nr:AraC family transcriptional regulator [Polymorphobacter sp. PAMC 29334]QYE32961.1 AraC family transcriptional regulator [Polymorphobacter sp. PAMC 29334]